MLSHIFVVFDFNFSLLVALKGTKIDTEW